MFKYLSFLILIFCMACGMNKQVIKEHVQISIYPYEVGNEMRASAMPEFKADSKLLNYRRRFEYLLINTPAIHLPEQRKAINKIFGLYPDTNAMKQRYLRKIIQDKSFEKYFAATLAPINNPAIKRDRQYTLDEVMEVASKFFYCDKVTADTNIQSHICIGLNGISEARWEKDYTLLSAFCFEAIFDDLEKDSSFILVSYSDEKANACKKYKSNITTLHQYLEDVKLELFDRMKHDPVLKEVLLTYYNLNKQNLAFEIIK